MSRRSGGSRYDSADADDISACAPRCAGLTQPQYDHLSATQPGFVAAPSRIDNYSSPMQNVVDRNWQEVLRGDPGYTWTADDQVSWKTNCGYGAHNAAEDLETELYGKE
jgi:hypothetical protein